MAHSHDATPPADADDTDDGTALAPSRIQTWNTIVDVVDASHDADGDPPHIRITLDTGDEYTATVHDTQYVTGGVRTMLLDATLNPAARAAAFMDGDWRIMRSQTGRIRIDLFPDRPEITPPTLSVRDPDEDIDPVPCPGAPIAGTITTINVTGGDTDTNPNADTDTDRDAAPVGRGEETR